MIPINSKSILFITGAFVSHSCWDPWRLYFESEGYKTYAPPWPYKDASVEELRSRQPNDIKLATLSTVELIDHYAKFAIDLPEKPILIGHSFGGLIAQILLNRDLGAAGVAIHSAPPMGVFPYEFSFLKSSWKLLGLFTSLKKTYMMSFKDWQYAFVNGMDPKEQRLAYSRFTIPESKTAARGALTSATKIDFKKPHAPLLFTAGSTDHIMPAHLNYRNYKKYKSNGSVLEYKEFPGKNHFVLGLPNWKEDADYILDWLEKHGADQITIKDKKSLSA